MDVNEDLLELERLARPRGGTTDDGAPWRLRASDHYDPATRRFFNPWKDTGKGPADLLRWWATAQRRPWPARVENASYPGPSRSVGPGEIALTFVGHSSMLVRAGDTTLLTDPHFSTHAGPFGRFGPARVREPGVAPASLPPIGIVFVSHNHYDHLDLPSLRWLDEHRSPLFVTCLGLKAMLEHEGLRRVVELDWWDEVHVGDVTLTVTPAQHWSNRSMFDRFATLWGGCYVRQQSGATVYFAGDSGYAPCFSDVRARLGAPDVALLPVGAYEPRWFMRDSHMNPDDAVRAHLDLGARTSVGIHFGCFRLADEGFVDPVAGLAAARRAHGVASDAFRVLDVGESVVLAESGSRATRHGSAGT
jgi:L-ascorbate metabolism protein UlaG (beta-lactamase superfamily)